MPVSLHAEKEDADLMQKRRSQSLSTTVLIAVLAVLVLAAAGVINLRHVATAPDAPARMAGIGAAVVAESRVAARHLADISALTQYRPGYSFWEHVFRIPDGSVVFGSATDGRQLTVTGRMKMREREALAARLEAQHGPILHNETRGTFASPGIRTYGPFFAEWGAIYERFGVPREIGLAQALLESGFIGQRRSEANAVGLCQFLESNWKLLDRLDPAVIEIANQTTQAAYCAAYLSVLATKYDSFIPALSEHHAGGTNIGRVLVSGERLGGRTPRDQYLMGSDFAVGLRAIGDGNYSDIYGSYGPRSYRYAEMVFGNAARIERTIEDTAQARVYAMRTTRAVTLQDIVRRTGLPADEVRRYNPALVKRVPAGATLYLPVFDETFGADVSFWHRDADPAFVALLDEFTAIDAAPSDWATREFATTLRDYSRRFRATDTHEGIVMGTILDYVAREAAGPREEILSTYRTSPKILHLFEAGAEALAE